MQHGCKIDGSPAFHYHWWRWPLILIEVKQSLWIRIVGFEERGKPEYPGKNLRQQKREPTTNSTHIWHRVRQSNPGHIGGRRALSPLRFPYSPISTLFKTLSSKTLTFDFLSHWLWWCSSGSKLNSIVTQKSDLATLEPPLLLNPISKLVSFDILSCINKGCMYVCMYVVCINHWYISER